MPDPRALTASELRDRFTAGDSSAVEIVDAYLGAIEQDDQQIGAFLHCDEASARASATELDAKRRRNEPLGPLAGVPVAVKDIFCTKDAPTTCASAMLENYRPPYDATVVAQLRRADAILIGKTNLDEFAMGSSNEHSAFKSVKNPWDRQRIPGGSSGGSAAAVAARMAPVAIGTDTGGSIRQPAALCGVYGLKPTYGRVSRYGLVAFASSLDQAGPFAHSVEDLALILDTIGIADSRDSTCSPRHRDTLCDSYGQPLEGLSIGLIREQQTDQLAPSIAQALTATVNVLKEAGASIKEVSLPHLDFAVSTYYLIASCEASGNLARYDGMHYGKRESEHLSLSSMYAKTRANGFGAEVKRRIMLGTYALSAGYYDAFYLKAQKVRRLIRDDYDQAWQEVDLLLGPTTLTTAFRLGEKSADPLAMYLEDIFTVSANLAGVPALSFPAGFDDSGLPIGLQLQGQTFQESTLLNAAWNIQQRTDWHGRSPR